MNSFIDDEEQEDAYEESFDNSAKRKKKRKKSRPQHFRVDDEDREIVKENVGIEIKKHKRLNRLAERERPTQQPSPDDKAQVKKEIEVQAKREGATKVESKHRYREQHEEMYTIDRRYDNSDKLRQMQNVFGNADEELELPRPHGGALETSNAADVQMEDVFPADEVDDPFSTKEDKQIEQTDICERL